MALSVCRGSLIERTAALTAAMMSLAFLQSVKGDAFALTGSMHTARTGNAATLLWNGTVLVTGGDSGGTVEVYYPTDGAWKTTGSIGPGHDFFVPATSLSNGLVLVEGGVQIFPPDEPLTMFLSSAELYDPVKGKWTGTASMNWQRADPTAVLLPNGTVLVAGGLGGFNSAEVYDPVKPKWTDTGSMSTARDQPSMTLLPDGQVLVAGGFVWPGPGPTNTAELYDPASETWTNTGSMSTNRYGHTATLLANGKVLVAGGVDKSAEIYDPAAGRWTQTGSMSIARSWHTATLLTTGRVLVTGGGNNSAEVFNPPTGQWTLVGYMNLARTFHTATLLHDGNVLVTGGAGANRRAELFVGTEPPKLTISSPKAGQSVGSGVFSISGTVTDQVALEETYYRLNDGAWTLAAPGTASNSWTASVTLMPGTNTLEAYAVDVVGNVSKTNQVIFAYNRYLDAQGKYTGLFAVANVARAQSNSGGFSFNLTSTGAFTGRLLLATNTNTLNGQFDLSGAYLTNFHRSDLWAGLQLDFNHHVTGMVSNSTFTAQLVGDQNAFDALHLATDFQGSYTLIIPGTNDPTVGPLGASCGTLTVDTLGNLVFAGSLADGTPISQSSVISRDGYWPFYVPLYGGNGSLWGWNYITNGAISSAPYVSWIRPANTTGNSVECSGFTNQQAIVLGSSFVSTKKPLLALTNGVVTLEGGGLAEPVTNSITLSRTGLITDTNAADHASRLSLTIKASGLLSGSLANPTNSKLAISLHGVLLQKQTNAAGYFTNANQSGMFSLEPH